MADAEVDDESIVRPASIQASGVAALLDLSKYGVLIMSHRAADSSVSH
jgi:hypothetical protein